MIRMHTAKQVALFYSYNNVEFPLNNGAILNLTQVIKVVTPSEKEAEIGASYINAREAVYIQQI